MTQNFRSMIPNREKSESKLIPNLKAHILIIGGLIVLLWTLELIDLLPFIELNRYGIRPRTLSGLWGILWAPFLHSGFPHLIANTLPLAFLGWLVLLRGYRDWVVVTLTTMVVGGLGTWLLGGTNTVHIGASGLVFGYFGFLLTRAIFERSLQAISTTLLVVMVYGSLIWGVLPLRIAGISWQMHLFGFLGGVLVAWLLPSPPDLEDDPQILILEEDFS